MTFGARLNELRNFTKIPYVDLKLNDISPQKSLRKVDQITSGLFEADLLEAVEALLAFAKSHDGLADRELAGQGILDYGSDVVIVLPFI